MERRIHRRFSRRIELRYWRAGESLAHTAYTTNISKSGLFLNSANALMPGERLRLEIVDRDAGFCVEGRVARVHRVALALRQVAQPGVGVRFLLPEELVDNLVPLARLSGQVTVGGREVDAEPLTGGDAASAGPLSGRDGRRSGGPDDLTGAPAHEPAAEVDRERVVPVEFSDPASFLSTYHRDISAGGLFVSMPDPLPLAAEIWISMQLPIPDQAPLLLAARVVQRFDPQAAVGDGRNLLAGMAVQFLEPERVLAELKPLLAALRR